MTLKKFISFLCAVSVFSISAISVAAASNYTPSVTKKDSVTITSAVDKDGNKIEITVTPISKSTDAPTEDAKNQMNEAFDEINKADSLDKLNIEGKNPFAANSDYVVSNLFDVSLNGIDNSYFKNGATIDVTFTINDLSTDVDSIWLHRYSTDNKWHAMDVEKIGSNSYKTTFSTLSPVAICVPSDAASSVTSPQTGDTTNYMLYIVVALSIPAFIGVAVYARKKLVA